MKNSIPIFLILFFIFILSGCEDNGSTRNRTVTGKGPVVTHNINVSEFTVIENIGVADFYITVGGPQSVILSAQQNIIDVMQYGVRNNIFKVSLEDDVSIENHEVIRFDITIPSINSIELTGVGNFYLSGDDQDELSIYVTGVGSVNAFELRVGTCEITFTGVGSCEVYVMNKLNVTISGIGNVFYKGSPEISSSLTGLGKLIDAN